MSYSSILKHVVLPVADKGMHTHTSRYLSEIKRLNSLPATQISEWQNVRLRKLIQHAYSTTNYYRALLDKLNVHPDDVRTMHDLALLPVLTKDDIRRNYVDLVSSKLHSIPHRKSATGGSTGNPLQYLRDNKSWSFSNANNVIHWERAGYKYGDKYVALGSTSLFVNKKSSWKHRLFYLMKSKIGLNGINMSDEVCNSYVDLLRSKKIRFIYGYASSIYLLAKYCLRKNIRLSITACFPTSEVLTEEYFATIKTAFNCNIVNCYGAHDGGITAYNHESGFFEVSYNCLVRTLDNPDGADQRTPRPALLTDLMNYAMPMINYQIGDEYVNVDFGSFGFNGQTIEQVAGRASDLLVMENGRVLTGPGFTILFKDLPVIHYCIQKVGVNAVKCFVLKDDEFNLQHEKLIVDTLRRQLGAEVQIELEYTDHIKRTKSGKVAYFITSESEC